MKDGGEIVNKALIDSKWLQRNRNPNSLFHSIYGDICKAFSVLSLSNDGDHTGVKEKGSNQKIYII